MKKQLIAIALFASFISVESFACSMPLPSVRQMMNLNQALESEQYEAAMKEQLKTDVFVQVKSITFERGVTVHLSNGCELNALSHYEASSHPGMCPKFVGVTVETACN